MGNWLQGISEWVSDAIPNEFSKLNNTWVGQIPYVGWAIKGLASADQFSETYANTGNFMDSAMYAGNGIMGNATDPYKYSPKNQPGFTDDWEMNVGKMLNLAGAFKSGNYMGGAQQGLGMLGSLDRSTAYAPARENVDEVPWNARVTMPVSSTNYMEVPTVVDFSNSRTPVAAPWMGVYG